MATYKVIITPEALADLEAIHAYIAIDSPANADRMVERILDLAQTLEEMLKRFRLVRTRRKLGYEARVLVLAPYRVIYSIDGTAVHIRTIRHGARKPWP